MLLTYDTVKQIGYVIGMEYIRFNDNLDMPDDERDGALVCSANAEFVEGYGNIPPLLIFTGLVRGLNMYDDMNNKTRSIYVINLKTLTPTKNSYLQTKLPSKIKELIANEINEIIIN